ncbi:formate dehydrogenase accessory sulfurtransferase FdhD [Desertibacillus haloalkaliphilus]|uniref:formate dehydrogenase accessory sulfurtransferase FdhD n=1 Tax=Desertibacillus haloalkaliphilus TaxID=1328930 RepID=UPI001C258803|nr:formate dehydrogenase accessory sulfurtransferase FdhD [Desertibacillus haloalkaliphilus]MBU8908295.1 formate dehydrogenase accessory sulfurtransferase FdhD [Desertibacillus haloalkaliphilus]
MTQKISLKRPIVQYSDNQFQSVEDEIATEFPLTIYVNNDEFATIVCTPTFIKEMVIGFLASEGIIRFLSDIKNININEKRGLAYVNLYASQITNQHYYAKRFIGSCCGKSRQFYFYNDTKTAKTSKSTTTITPQQCISLMRQLQEKSNVFKKTGGVHNAALSTPSEMIVTHTDIGRHNALDKLYGHCLLNQIPVRDKILTFSGRISSEVLTKAAKIGVGIILSKSAPTDLAIKLADDLNITAVGFIRGNSFNVYSHSYRIVESTL